MLQTHYFFGGPLAMSIIYGLWVGAILLFGWLIYCWAKGSESMSKRKKSISESILFLGSFAFLMGILFQVIGIIEALIAIEAAGDVSMALIAGGLKVSLIAPVYGFTLFVLTYIIWFVNRRFSNAG
ncbi:MAG: MotA/TolQ/ExbB proton channel family protein [Tenuifilaceae bacterium]|jgi:biopolymer transport protein ExbB/TolQ|nr:MotA/TolQ/ExbB proton channel family protein [Tenuifilaceae bacterium]